MPIYEYRCERCGHTFEKLILARAVPLPAGEEPACSRCGAGPAARIHSAFSARSGAAGSASRAPSGSSGGGCGRPGGCGCS